MILSPQFPRLGATITSNILQTRQSSNFRKFKNWYASLSPKRSQKPPFSHVVQIGDPILRRKADPVQLETIKSKEMKILIEHLKRLLKKYECSGLSAPQIGIPLRIFLMEFVGKEKEFSPEIYKARKMREVPLTVSKM